MESNHGVSTHARPRIRSNVQKDLVMARTDLNAQQRSADEAPALPGWLLQYRGVVIWLFHMGLAIASSYIAFWVRFDGTIPSHDWALWRDTLAALLVARGTMFVAFRLYEGLWRYTSVRDLLHILLSVGLSSLAFLVVIQEGLRVTSYPLSILLIDALLLTCFAGGVRFIARVHRDLVAGTGGRKVLIYGAGDAGEAVVREMRLSLSTEYDPVGFVDDDPGKAGQRIHGVPVLGTREDLPRIMMRQQPDEVLVTIPRAEPSTYRAVVRALERFEVPIKTLPHLREILDGNVSTSLIRDLSLEDLLRRTPVGLSQEPLLELIGGRMILVTGAGGSIGAELCRQIAALNPSGLILYERHENSLYSILNDLTNHGALTGALYPVIGDVTDRSRFKAVLEEHRPEIVFHAAAHKHVPLMEENICEAVKNNVLGTRVAIEVAEECGVERFILISTDKAVNPVSIMGATKRVAELMLQSRASGNRTTFVTVRFGNVLGSNGSVIPLFVEQLKHRGPLTVTHPDVRRYFMLIPEAVQLVLHAAAAGEPNSIYVLDMGEPVRLVDVARDLIRLSGFRPDEVPITFIGLRPGEKLDEELVGRDEVVSPSPVQSVMQVRPHRTPEPAWLWGQIGSLERSARLGDSAAVMRRLRTIVPEFGSATTPSALPSKVTVIAAAAVRQPMEEEPQPALVAGSVCRSCASSSVHRSRVNGPIEQIRRQLTAKRPYRCHACGWRGWLDIIDVAAPPVMASVETLPDFRAIDAALRTPFRASPPPLLPATLSRLDPSRLAAPEEAMAGDAS
jgi:FlaA1/EpsC-like NDP-sugar epimerase